MIIFSRLRRKVAACPLPFPICPTCGGKPYLRVTYEGPLEIISVGNPEGDMLVRHPRQIKSVPIKCPECGR